jgi:hydroxymethylpyrimidine pyrophosphatase-like HAD family hydrolase
VTPRLVATDLDGTLVRRDGSVSSYTRQVLAALDLRGIPVIFVTGRPLRWATPVFEHVGSHGLAIVSNGAMVWDVAEHLPRMTRAMEGAVALEVAERIRAAVPGSMFGAERADGFVTEAGYPTGLETGATAASLSELTDRPMLKLLGLHPDLEPDDYWRRAEAAAGDLATVTHSSRRALLEISAHGVTKASTLAEVCATLGVEAPDVIAFGDMPNDLAMLTWAGHSYAMADAHPAVVACAGHLAPSHEEDGVARVLAEVFGL